MLNKVTLKLCWLITFLLFSTVSIAQQTLPYVTDICGIKDKQSVRVGRLIVEEFPNGDISVKFTVDKGLNDNSYGANEHITWDNDPNKIKHKFKDLVGSDKSVYKIYDKNGTLIFEFNMDYISEDKTGTYPSGYGTLGVSGGDGSMKKGNAAYLYDFNTSLTKNLNDFGYFNNNPLDLTSTSPNPGSGTSYEVDPNYPNWIWELQYEYKIKKEAFGAVGFGRVDVIDMHNSPAKVAPSNYQSCEPDDGETCIEPPAWSQCTPPTLGYDKYLVVSGNVSWNSLVGNSSGYESNNFTRKVNITGAGILTVTSGDLKLLSGALLVIDGPTLIVNNGKFFLESNSIAIIQNSVLRTFGDIQQKSNSYLCIIDSEVECGEEEANGLFNTTGNTKSSANFQNDGGKRYLKNVCLNVTHDFQLSSTAGGEDRLIYVWAEIGDEGPTHLNSGNLDGDDSGNFQNSSLMKIYGSQFIVAENIQNESNGTMEVCDVAFRTINGHFQNSGLLKGEDLCLWVDDNHLIQDNGGNWFVEWRNRRGQTDGYIPNLPPNASIDSISDCFTDACSPQAFSAVGDFVWNDLNINGVQDNGEPGVAGVEVRLFDCNDNLLATTTTDENGFYLFDELDAGNYYVQFILPDGAVFTAKDQGTDDALDSDADVNTGKTDCFNLQDGQDDLTRDAGLILPPKTSCIGDRVWIDSNCDGIQDVSEPGLEWVTVELYDCNDNKIAWTMTDANGNYQFCDVLPGQYYLKFLLIDGNSIYSFTQKDAGSDDEKDSDVDPATGKTVCFDVFAGVDDFSRDAGVCEPVETCEIGDRVWNDLNKNGIQDAGEPGVEGIPVKLYDCDDNLIASKTTDANGYYLFENVTTGNYYVKFFAPTGWVFTLKDQGSSDLFDSDADPNTGRTDCFSIDPPYCDSNSTRWDAGIYEHQVPQFGSIGDSVWIDENKNGIQDPGEAGLEWVTVDLYDCDGNKLDYRLTDSNGNYLFDNLSAGSYLLKFHLIDGNSIYTFTLKNAGNDPSIDSDVNPQTGETDCFNLAVGQNDLTRDAGVILKTVEEFCDIGDKVWNDLNKNGKQDSGEPGVPGVPVKLYDCSDNLIASTTTDANGLYLFTNVAAGNYYLKFFAPTGWLFTLKDQGSNDLLDSDADPNTGKTDCFPIDPPYCDSNSTKWDAGLYEHPTTPTLGSIGDRVWFDADGDGIQDPGEAGAADVKVRLFACDNTLLKSTTTDNNGYYLFADLEAGEYYVKFILPDGFVFSPKNQGGNPELDSDANQNGMTECFTLNAGQNDLSRDAGICLVSTPEVTINKTDNKTIMPAVGLTNTYTISFSNSGNVPLTDVKITDVLPAGVEYVSCSGAVSCGETVYGSGVVDFNIGTLNVGQSGQVNVTVKVKEAKSEYLNVACLKGKDNSGNWIEVCDDDLNLGDDCSGGDDNGIESRGDMAELLLKRQLKIKYGMTTPLVAKNKGNSIMALHNLNNLIPAAGPLKSTAFETTPFDILGISNALESYAVDYIANTEAGSRRVAGIFSTITAAPKIYDHTKAVCDKLAGKQVTEINLITINGHDFYAARFVDEKNNISDFAISFSVYETADGYKVENKWTYNEYAAPSGASSVYNFQVWSSTQEGTVDLVEDILAKFKSFGSVSYMNTVQNKPDTYIKQAKYSHDEKVDFTVVNKDAPKNVSFTVVYRTSQGSEQLQFTENVSLTNGENTVTIQTGIIADAQVYMTQSEGFNDEAFVSGGAFTYLTGPNSIVNSFNSNYPAQNVNNYQTGSMVLAGGAGLNGQLSDWVSVVRSLTANASAYDLSSYGSVRFDARGTGVLDVIIDLSTTVDFNYHTFSVNLNPNTQTYIINFSDFKLRSGNNVPLDASKIKSIGFILDKGKNPSVTSFNLDISNIAFINKITDVTEVETSVKEFSLAQNYPNPFNPSTVITFSVANKEMLSLKIFNVLGEEVASLINGEVEAGVHRVTFDAAGLSSGIYFYKLTGNSVNLTRKMILSK